jgi:acetyl-CoA carboxylase carboxyl transferase subunit beta
VADPAFRAATMGHVVGEKVCLALEHAAERRLPAVLFCASGGARVNEGLIALMQMPKTSAAVGRLNAAGLPYITVLTHPTYAGVMASFASLGDVVVAEPGAGLGFTGPRVIELSLKRKGPFEWQTAEFMLAHGLIDLIVPRRELPGTVARLLALSRPQMAGQPAAAPADAGPGDERDAE